MQKILFIYGYGGSPESTFCQLLRANLPSELFEVVSFEYPQHDCVQAVAFLSGVIVRENIDIVMGTSLGGFITLALDTDKPRAVINPCMLPSVELPKLEPREGHPEDVKPSGQMISSYLPYEDKVAHSVRCGEPIVGFFGQQDELLGTRYQSLFQQHYSEAIPVPGGHHGNQEAMPPIVSRMKRPFRQNHIPCSK